MRALRRPPPGDLMGLDEWRARIDEIDRQLLRLLNQRAELSVEIGHTKRESGDPVLVPEREQEILDALARLNPGPLSEGAIRSIWSEVLSASRSLQRPFRVAYLGPQGTNTHMAALRHFGSSAEFQPVRGIPEVFEEVERRRADVGVVPIENSSEGVVNHTLDGLIDSELLICGEASLEIHHNLLSRAAELGDVKRVFSHPQALAQCRGWLSRHLTDAGVMEVLSTSAAAETAGRAAPVRARRSALPLPRPPGAHRGLRQQRDTVCRDRPSTGRADGAGQNLDPVLHPRRGGHSLSDPRALRHGTLEPDQDRIATHPAEAVGVRVLRGLRGASGRSGDSGRARGRPGALP